MIKKKDEAETYQITLTCKKIPLELITLLNTLQVDKYLIGYIGTEIHRITYTDIFYIESVDKKIFLYGEHKIFSSKQKLYELEEALRFNDFLRISKTTIINVNKIKKITPISSGKLQATLINDEKIIISKQYRLALKKRLGLSP